MATATSLQEYRLDGILAAGRAGPVHRGVRQADGLAVVLHLISGLTESARRRFTDQARDLMAVPPHRYLWPVLDAGVAPDGTAYLVTARAAGSMADHLADHGPLPLARAVGAAASAAAGLDALHGAGLLHGNVTPANLLVGADGAVAVTGVVLPALVAAGPAPDVAYRPPEVLRGADWTAAADTYALAATVFALLTGRPPYGTAGSERDRLLRALTGPVPRTGRPDLPAAVEEALQRGLAPDPAARPATPGGFAALLTGRAGPEESEDAAVGGPAPVGSRQETGSRQHTGSRQDIGSRQETLPPTTPVPPAPRPPRPLGSGYLLEEPIGRGATGQVWRGRRTRDGSPVAIKVLRAELVEEPDMVVRFLRERTTLVGLDHPHLVRVHDLVAEGETLAIVMDLVDGADLRQVMTRAPLRPDEATTVLGQVADALAAVHAAGVVHRDLKPENVLVERRDGRVIARLTDFGIARTAGAATLTRLSQVVGTPAYIAPEVLAGRTATPAVDVYAFGVLGYEVLTGRRPFEADNPAALLRAHLDETPQRPPGLPDPVWRLLASCLAKDPATRPAAAALAQATPGLGALLTGRPAGPLPAGAVPAASAPAPPGTSPSQAGMPGPGRSPAEAAWMPAAAEPGWGQQEWFTASRSGVPAPAPGTGAVSRLDPLPTEAATAPPPQAPAPPPARRSRWRPVLAVTTVVALGAAGGVALAVREDRAAPPPAQPTRTTVRSVSVPLPTHAVSRRPGEITLTFTDVSKEPGFQGYLLYRDGHAWNPVSDSPYQFTDPDTVTRHCFQIRALIATAEPLPTRAQPPACLIADGRS